MSRIGELSGRTGSTLAGVLLAAVGLAMAGGTCSDSRSRPQCTAFMFRHDSGVVTGKNLDWPIGAGSVLLNPAGLGKSAWVEPPDDPVIWVSRLASITLNQFGREFPLGGMNEKGLVVEELSYWPTDYPVPDERPVLNELQWIQYLLDSFATVAEVIEAETSVRIAPFLFGLHYFVTDATGNAAVIEYLDGASVVHAGDDLPVAALANDEYRNLLRQLPHYRGFGGAGEPRSSRESPDRFALAAMRLRRFAGSPPGAPVDSAFALLDDLSQDDTQWSIVYDPAAGAVHFRTSGRRSVRTVRFPDDVQECGSGAQGVRMDDPAAEWAAWSRADNDRLLEDVFEALDVTGMGTPSREIRESMRRYPASMTCVAPRRER